MAAVVESLAKKLLQDVAVNDLGEIEKTLSSGSAASSTLRTAITHSISILTVLDNILKNKKSAHKLLAYDINNISPFHLAALLGQNEVIVTMVDKICTLADDCIAQDVAVDIRLDSHSTALHLAAFAGRIETVKMLLDVYKAGVNLQDKYGWTPLHYASTEGHLAVVKELVSHGANIDLRDKDGTSAAWRAEINKHQVVVRFLCEHGDEEDLLNVEDTEDADRQTPNVEDLYASVNKQPKQPKQSGTKSKSASDSPLYDFVDTAGGTSYQRPLPGYEMIEPDLLAPLPPPKLDKNQNVAKQGDIRRQKSMPTKLASQRPMSEMGTAGSTRTLPPGVMSLGREARKSTIRRLIRNELEAVFSDYELPQNVMGGGDGGAAAASGAAPAGELPMGMGMGTLRGLMREELDKYRRQHLAGEAAPLGGGGGAASGGDAPEWADNNDYEDLYETLKSMPPPPPVPKQAPPLPPRNPGDPVPADTVPAPPLHDPPKMSPPPAQTPPTMFPPPGQAPPTIPDFSRHISDKPITIIEPNPNKAKVTGMVMLSPEQPTSMALEQSIHKLARIIGPDWKRLAKALPIERKPAKCDEKIAAIAKQYPGNEENQAKAALSEWRINIGRGATVDDIIIGLRKCSLHAMIDEVEKVASEFTA